VGLGWFSCVACLGVGWVQRSGSRGGCDGDGDGDGDGDCRPDSERGECRYVKPVPILAQSKGCVVADGTNTGFTDIVGDRYATCKLDTDGKGGEVLVRTYPGDPRVLDQKMRSDDSQALIFGSTFVAIVRPPYGLTSSKMSLTDIAAQVGGTVLPAA